MRLFVAIDLARDIRRSISTLVEGLRGFAPEARWISAESLHLTLKFIGESEKLDTIRAALEAIPSPPVEISFRDVGFFPTARNARVFWAGVESDERLAALARKIEDSLLPLGIPKEEHPFTPHITLARAPGHQHSKRGTPPFAILQKRLDAMPQPDLGTMTAQEFFLYQSKTGASGAIYTKLARFELR